MKLHSFAYIDTDLLNDLRPWETWQEGLVTRWWTTRDAAFFAMLATRVDELNDAIAESDDEDKVAYQQDLAEWLDPASWKTDSQGTPYFAPGRESLVSAYLVEGSVDD